MSEKIMTPEKKEGNTLKKLIKLYEFFEWRIEDCKAILESITPPYEPNETTGLFPDIDSVNQMREPTVREMVAFMASKSELLKFFPEIKDNLTEKNKNKLVSP